MEELLKDLEGLGLVEAREDDSGDDIGVRVNCKECEYDLGDIKCLKPGACYTATLRYIAKKLKELGWVKVTRCGECKWWRRNDESQTEGSHLCNCWTSPYNNGMMRSGEFCQEGMLKEGK